MCWYPNTRRTQQNLSTGLPCIFRGNTFQKIKWNVPAVSESLALGKHCENNTLIIQVCICTTLQGYCDLQLSSAVNLPCKFELSLISLLPSLPELLRFPSLFNLLVGPDPPFCKLIIQLNVGNFHRSCDVVLVLQMIEKMSFLVLEKKKRAQRLLQILKHHKRREIVIQSYLEK